MASSSNSMGVDFANPLFAFMSFQNQYRNLCQQISTQKMNNLHEAFKKANSFMFEYLAFVETTELRDIFINSLNKIKEDLFNDEEYDSLCKIKLDNTNKAIIFNQKYYEYLIRILVLIGKFGDELSKTFMPTKTDKEKLFIFKNNNSFFEQFTSYKSKTAEQLSNFSIRNFKESFAYYLGFYYAYYLFIDERSRFLCEKIFSNILNIVLSKEVLTLMIKPKREFSTDNHQTLKDLDLKIHEGLNYTFFRCNYSYSLYNILPRVEKKLHIDRTSI